MFNSKQKMAASSAAAAEADSTSIAFVASSDRQRRKHWMVALSLTLRPSASTMERRAHASQERKECHEYLDTAAGGRRTEAEAWEAMQDE